jgi:hypothetical protein
LGILDPYIPFEKIPVYWRMNVHDYLQDAGVGPGWAWTGLLGYGDFLNFIGIAILAGVTILCYAAIVPLLFRNNDKVFAVMAALEVIVLSLAASGLLAVGGH